LLTNLGARFNSKYPFNSLPSLMLFSLFDSIALFSVLPFEVAKIHLLTQSFLYSEKKLHGITDVLQQNFHNSGIGGLFPNPVLSFGSKLLQELTKSIPSFILEMLVARFRLDVTSISIQALLISTELFLINASLLFTLPLDTIRHRLMMSNLASKARIPIREYNDSVWNCFFSIIKEEGWSALYQGIGFRIVQNTVGLVSNWLLHLNGELLEPDDLDSF
jgi:hypothetical protein